MSRLLRLSFEDVAKPDPEDPDVSGCGLLFSYRISLAVISLIFWQLPKSWLLVKNHLR
jgi:hypothetical protein